MECGTFVSSNEKIYTISDSVNLGKYIGHLHQDCPSLMSRLTACLAWRMLSSTVSASSPLPGHKMKKLYFVFRWKIGNYVVPSLKNQPEPRTTRELLSGSTLENLCFERNLPGVVSTSVKTMFNPTWSRWSDISLQLLSVYGVLGPNLASVTNRLPLAIRRSSIESCWSAFLFNPCTKLYIASLSIPWPRRKVCCLAEI